MKNSINPPNSNFFRLLSICAVAILLVSACKPEPEPEPEDPCMEAILTGEWGYDDFGGPACWNSVCNHGQTCGGTSQSPINVTGWVEKTNLPSLSTNPGQTSMNIVNNGHTLQFNMQPGSFATYGTTTNGLFDDFTLGQFHFHTNSEHQVNGSYAPMEVHFVHRSIWDDRYMVISVMIEEGDANPLLERFVDKLPVSEMAGPYVNKDSVFSAYDLLPANRSYYTYAGSLTTPPCSETVNWIIMENKIQASQAQLDKFKSILGENFRPVQELGSREIGYVKL